MAEIPKWLAEAADQTIVRRSTVMALWIYCGLFPRIPNTSGIMAHHSPGFFEATLLIALILYLRRFEVERRFKRSPSIPLLSHKSSSDKGGATCLKTGF
jgi:hypothetical protein